MKVLSTPGDGRWLVEAFPHEFLQLFAGVGAGGVAGDEGGEIVAHQLVDAGALIDGDFAGFGEEIFVEGEGEVVLAGGHGISVARVPCWGCVTAWAARLRRRG